MLSAKNSEQKRGFTTSFGVTIKERTFAAQNTRYQFNGKEYDSETETSDFGARNLDGDLGVMETLDAFKDKNPTYSPYSYVDDSPILLIDKDGNFRMTNRLQKKYPQLTNLLKNIQQTVHDNPKTFEAFKETLGISDEQANEILEWGKGPKVKLRRLSGELENESYGLTTNSKAIKINRDLIKTLEGKEDNPISKEGLNFAVYSTLLHEAQHHIEFKYDITKFDPYDGGDPKHEAGFTFELKAFGGIGGLDPSKGSVRLKPFLKTFDEMTKSMGFKLSDGNNSNSKTTGSSFPQPPNINKPREGNTTYE